MTESDLYIQIARFMSLKYPNVLYHFDLMGVNNNSPITRSLYGQLNGRGWPDLFIAYPKITLNGGNYLGLFLELKKDGVSIYKRNGELRKDPHLHAQAQVLDGLQGAGYMAEFAVGLDDAVNKISEYLSLK